MESWRFAAGDEIVPGRDAVELLGGGTRYEAYLAWDDRLRCLVVAKMVRPDLVRDERALAGLAGEARALDRLAHPMLLRSFAAQLDGDRPHLVLEHIEGARLSTLIRRFGVILEQLLPLALNMCSVLHYMARERMLHLDVKPRNIIMAGAPRLIDLSVARSFEEVSALTSPVGTDAYMAPEQCDPQRFAQIGPAADVWGLGVTLHEALTAERPFPEPKGERFPQLVARPRSLPDDVPGPLAELLSGCLEWRPQDRPSAGELGDRLEPLVASLPAPKIGPFRPGYRTMLRELDVR